MISSSEAIGVSVLNTESIPSNVNVAQYSLIATLYVFSLSFTSITSPSSVTIDTTLMPAPSLSYVTEIPAN